MSREDRKREQNANTGKCKETDTPRSRKRSAPEREGGDPGGKHRCIGCPPETQRPRTDTKEEVGGEDGRTERHQRRQVPSPDPFQMLH